MKRTPRNKPAPHPTAEFRLSGELTIQSVGSQVDSLNSALATANDVFTVNLKDVEVIDSAGLQLLLYSKAQCARRKIAWQLAAVSDPVKAYLLRFNIVTTEGALL